MKNAACVIVPLSLLAVSCSDPPQPRSSNEVVQRQYDTSWMDHEELCSSVRRVSKDAVNGFAAFKAGERLVSVSKTESMSRVYREYQENETWFHMPGASDCYISNSLDRPPGTIRWAHYKCRWSHATLDEAESAFLDVNRYIEICVDAEDIAVRQEKDGQHLSRRIFRAPETSLHLYTIYHTVTFDDEETGPPVLDMVFQASIKPQ